MISDAVLSNTELDSLHNYIRSNFYDVPTLQINTVNISITGQSNAIVYNTLADAQAAEVDVPYISGTKYINSSNQIVDMNTSQINLGTDLTGGYGYEHRLSDLLSQSGLIGLFCKVAKGGSWILAGDWDPDTVTGDDLDEQVISVFLNTPVNNRFMIWYQGEASAANLTRATSYETSLTNLLKKFRSSLLIEKIFIIELHDAPNSFDYADEIKTAQTNVANALDFCELVTSPEGLTYRDGVHFDSSGADLLARHIFNNHISNYV